jgi:cytochrome c-type biogenesis protein
MAPLLRGIGLFVAGFTVVFVALGAAASGVGRLLDSHEGTLTTAAGAVVVALGTVLVVSALPAGAWARLGAGTAGRFGRLTRERRFHVRPSVLGVWAAPVMGMAFAFAWTPCIGPVLGAVLGLAATRSTLAGGVLLLFAYSIGLGVPFLVTGVAFSRLTSFFARARRALWVVNLVAGGVLVAFGAILLAGQLGWLSGQFQALLNHLGLERLTTS